jgi:hypothetical protein
MEMRKLMDGGAKGGSAKLEKKVHNGSRELSMPSPDHGVQPPEPPSILSSLGITKTVLYTITTSLQCPL